MSLHRHSSRAMDFLGRLVTVGIYLGNKIEAGSREGGHQAGNGTVAIVYFKLYKSQMPVVAQAIETAAPMLGSDKS